MVSQVCNQPVNLDLTPRYSIQSSNHSVRCLNNLFSHVMVLNEEEAGEILFNEFIYILKAR